MSAAGLAPGLFGLTVDQFAGVAGVGRVEAFRALEKGVRDGKVARVECGTWTGYCRPEGGRVQPEPKPEPTPRPRPKPGNNGPRDHRQKKGRR